VRPGNSSLWPPKKGGACQLGKWKVHFYNAFKTAQALLHQYIPSVPNNNSTLASN